MEEMKDTTTKTTKKSKVKCNSCKKQGFNTDEDFIKRGNRYFCLNCFCTKEREANSWKIMIDTIVNYYGIKAPTGIILGQIKDFVDNHDITYDGITYTLWYCKEILQLEDDFTPQVAVQYGINIVRIKYPEARNFYEQQMAIEKSVQRSLANKVKTKKVTININKINKKRKTKIVDFNSLL